MARTVLVVLVGAMLSSCGGGSGPPAEYTISGTVAGLNGSGLVLQNNSAGNLAISASGSFTFAGSLLSGASYQVTIQSQPTAASSGLAQTCAVTSGQGVVVASDVTNVMVTCYVNPARFAYVVNSGSDSVSAFAIDPISGALSPVTGSPFAAGSGAVSITIHPSGKFAYVSNGVSNTISGYSVDPSTGALTPLSGSPFAVAPFTAAGNFGITPVVIDPSGTFAFVGNPGGPFNVPPAFPPMQSSNFFAFTIDASSGILTAVSGSPFTTGSLYPKWLAVTPSGDFVYVVNALYESGSEGAGISAYHIDPQAGTVTLVTGSPFEDLWPMPSAVIISPSSDFLYVLGSPYGYFTAMAYSIDSSTGVPTSIAGSPFTVSGNLQSALSFTPNGNFAYAAAGNEVDSVYKNSVYAYSVASSGALSAVSGSPFATQTSGSASSALVIDSLGKFVYTTNSSSNTVSGYTIASADGTLTAISGSPFSVAAAPTALTVDTTSDRFLFVSESTSNGVSVFAVDSTTGALTSVSGSPFATGTTPGAVVLLQ